ncbi:polysaccharide biosynthesis/export family protein [Spirosoma validum]|uniref:Polysaccharide biosynthesis/export family protein n=1 Tax=Spirosoma validum TaxID=2771355 RepID=A0A927AZ59_9BACT|nr:polysaccharide biosynthesis/export family protein [Spirosoma validum]MBD2752556.1 polysaccharide biosynthesis/export family protein [Spirosoma validum]
MVIRLTGLVRRQQVIGVTVFLFSVVQLSSCTSVKPPQFDYFKSKDRSFPKLVETVVPQVSRIQKGDILGVIVSSLNKESNEILNFTNVNSLPVSVFSGGSVSGGSQPLGFLVDSSGYISMPIIGRQKVDGLTLELAESKLRANLEKTLKEPSVNVRFMNHKFSVLGEVKQVGTFNLLDDQTTILDVLAACGDLTEYAKRDSITVIRNKNGMREIGKVNLRSLAVFKSPYFYIQNGDVVYVEPTQDKVIAPKPLSAGLQKVAIYVGLATSVVSLIFLGSRL